MDRKAIKTDAMLFNLETTSRSDYRWISHLNILRDTKYKDKDTCHRIRPQLNKDFNTLKEWKVPNVPFTLFWRNKEIVREDPGKFQTAYVAPTDTERKEFQRTRPRLVMTPAASLDDAEEPSRGLLIKDVYMSNYMATIGEPMKTADTSTVRAPLPDAYAPACPLRLGKLAPPVVPPEWRMDSVSWDERSLKGYCDPNRVFWLATKLPKCSACDQTAEVEARKKMQRNGKS